MHATKSHTKEIIVNTQDSYIKARLMFGARERAIDLREYRKHVTDNLDGYVKREIGKQLVLNDTEIPLSDQYLNELFEHIWEVSQVRDEDAVHVQHKAGFFEELIAIARERYFVELEMEQISKEMSEPSSTKQSISRL